MSEVLPATTLFVHPSDEMYGADRVLLETAIALAPAEVNVWLPADKRYVERPLSAALRALNARVTLRDLPILRRRELNPRGVMRLLMGLLRTSKQMRAAGPSQILLSTTAVLPLVLTVPRRTKVVVHIHEIWSGPIRAILGPLLIRARVIVVPSEAVAESLPTRHRSKTVVIPNGTEDPGSPEAWPESGLTLVVASRWGAWKGYELLLQAWSVLRRDDLRLVILGGAPPAGTAVDVPSIVESMPNAHTVRIVGEVDDIGPYVEAAHAVVVPSTNPEPFGLVSIEGMARGRPVIATVGGGSGEIVTRGSGWLLPPDPGSWASFLQSLELGQIQSAGAVARQHYLQNYTAEVFRGRIAEVLR